MMKPEPSEVTCRGTFCWPRKSLNRSLNGESGGRLRPTCGPALRVWLVAMFTTVGSRRFARSANESGAGRASATIGHAMGIASAAAISKARKGKGRRKRMAGGLGIARVSQRRYSRKPVEQGAIRSRLLGRMAAADGNSLCQRVFLGYRTSAHSGMVMLRAKLFGIA